MFSKEVANFIDTSLTRCIYNNMLEDNIYKATDERNGWNVEITEGKPGKFRKFNVTLTFPNITSFQSTPPVNIVHALGGLNLTGHRLFNIEGTISIGYVIGVIVKPEPRKEPSDGEQEMMDNFVISNIGVVLKEFHENPQRCVGVREFDCGSGGLRIFTRLNSGSTKVRVEFVYGPESAFCGIQMEPTVALLNKHFDEEFGEFTVGGILMHSNGFFIYLSIKTKSNVYTLPGDHDRGSYKSVKDTVLGLLVEAGAKHNLNRDDVITLLRDSRIYGQELIISLTPSVKVIFEEFSNTTPKLGAAAYNKIVDAIVGPISE